MINLVVTSTAFNLSISTINKGLGNSNGKISKFGQISE